MFEEILPNLYRVEVPLSGSPLQSLNSYIIRGTQRSLVIDTGWNREECRRALTSGLRELTVDLEVADFFITHAHADHSGLVSELATNVARIYIGWADAVDLSSTESWRWEKQTSFA